MTQEEISALTKDYNEKRKSFSFHTVAASESGIKSILANWPELEQYKDDKETLIYKIACILHHLAFD